MQQTTIVNLAVLATLAIIGYVTNNPLVIMGLLLLQATPPEPQYVEVERDEDDGNVSSHKIGFLSKT